MQNRHRTVRRIPIGIDSPEIMQLGRIGLSVVSDSDNPLQGRQVPEFGQLHFARERGLDIFPAQYMRAGVVILPLAGLDVRRFDADPFSAASAPHLNEKGRSAP